jgi:hypothetical protein
MKDYPHIKTKRGFVRERRKALKSIKKMLFGVRTGCAITAIYGKDTKAMMSAVTDLNDAIRRIDEITKKLA